MNDNKRVSNFFALFLQERKAVGDFVVMILKKFTNRFHTRDFLFTGVSLATGLLAILNLGAMKPRFAPRVDRGLIEHNSIDEASGLAASRLNKNVLWVHNDSGKHPRIFALDIDGGHLGTYFLPGLNYRDWEDIAVGPGPDAGQFYIYLGNIGDNEAEYDLKYIYRIPEPNLRRNGIPVRDTLRNVDTITFRYPDGKRDAETLMVDPLTRDILIISKRESEVHLYRMPYPQSTSHVITVEHVATLPMNSVVAGDISPSGLEILVKTYDTVYYWQRKPEESVVAALQKEGGIAPYVLEPQGEAVCWDAAASGYYTTSEELAHLPAHLYYYSRLAPATAGKKAPRHADGK